MKLCSLCAGMLLLWAPLAAGAGPVLEIETNDALAHPQFVDGHFTLDYSVDIGNGTHVENTSLSIPHVTVTGGGDGSFDYYAFTFPGAGTTSGFVVLDIDHSASPFDSHLALWSPSGDLLGHNDAYDHRGGAAGSTRRDCSLDACDALMTTYISAPGIYVVGVARSAVSPGPGPEGYVGDKPLAGDAYTLQISVENMPLAPVPEPGGWTLLALGLGALTWRLHRPSG